MWFNVAEIKKCRPIKNEASIQCKYYPQKCTYLPAARAGAKAFVCDRGAAIVPRRHGRCCQAVCHRELLYISGFLMSARQQAIFRVLGFMARGCSAKGPGMLLSRADARARAGDLSTLCLVRVYAEEKIRRTAGLDVQRTCTVLQLADCAGGPTSVFSISGLDDGVPPDAWNWRSGFCVLSLEYLHQDLKKWKNVCERGYV